jgi:hypothetical protein
MDWQNQINDLCDKRSRLQLDCPCVSTENMHSLDKKDVMVIDDEYRWTNIINNRLRIARKLSFRPRPIETSRVLHLVSLDCRQQQQQQWNWCGQTQHLRVAA